MGCMLVRRSNAEGFTLVMQCRQGDGILFTALIPMKRSSRWGSAGHLNKSTELTNQHTPCSPAHYNTQAFRSQTCKAAFYC
ncbi:uncharacterized [Tachysurus ichikawai]